MRNLIGRWQFRVCILVVSSALFSYSTPSCYAQTPESNQTHKPNNVAEPQLALGSDEIQPSELLSKTTAQQKALNFLSHKDIQLQWQGYSSWGTTKARGKVCYHFEGSNGQGLSLDVDAISGCVYRYTWTRLAVESQKVVLTLPQAAVKAEQFLINAAQIHLTPNIVLHRSTYYDHLMGGKTYEFSWGEILDGIEYPFSITVTVSASTGQVTHYLLIDDAIILPTLIPLITKDQATNLASSTISLQPGWKTLFTRLAVTPANPTQRLQWHIRAQGMRLTPYSPEYGQLLYEAIEDRYIDAKTGQMVWTSSFKVPDGKTSQVRAAMAQPQILFSDLWPSWSPSNQNILLCESWRDIDQKRLRADSPFRANGFSAKDRNLNYNRYTYLLSSIDTGKMNALLAIPHYSDAPRWTSDGKRMAFTTRNTVYILDLKSGAIGLCNDRQRVRRDDPSWDTTGNFLSMSGDHAGGLNRDRDIYVAKIAPTIGAVSIEKQWCVEHLKGRDFLPEISPTGRQIVFAHENPIGRGATNLSGSISPQMVDENYSLYTIRGQLGTAEWTSPMELGNNLPPPERLSWFPDGKRVLVCYWNNDHDFKYLPEIIDVVHKQRQRLNLSHLYDPDLPNSKPLIIRCAVLNPTGDKIAFSALRWTGKPNEKCGCYIYICNLDGSHLKRVSPSGGQPLRVKHYLQSGIHALNAWEKLAPKSQ